MHASLGCSRPLTGTSQAGAAGPVVRVCCAKPGANGGRGRRSVQVFAANGAGEGKKKKRKQKQQDQTEENVDATFSLDDINPYAMGRRSRALFDDVWQQFTKLTSPTQSVGLDDVFTSVDDLSGSVFETPQAPSTTVLVVGATGRVGRILVRKLLLRGYKVRALVRTRDGDTLKEAIPQSVDVVIGDVGDYAACKKAVEGVDKIICCVGARTDLTADLSRVEENGVYNLGRAYLDWLRGLERGQAAKGRTKKRLADSRSPDTFKSWKVEQLGMIGGSAASRRVFDRGQDSATVEVDEATGQLVFSGTVRSRGGIAEVGSQVELPFEDTMANTEGLVLRVAGDGNQYSVTITTGSGGQFSAKLATRQGYLTARLPYNTFRSVNTDDPLDPADICHLSLRYEPRIGRPAVVVAGPEPEDSRKGGFRLAVDFIKALPGGEETDFVLVSCAGTPRPGWDPSSREKILSFKRKGEAKLRNSGLGYTIIRPGPMVEEPGGYKALVFDQGNRITQGISYADVADVCLKALHDPLARNKAFEVCYEYTPEAGLEMYELVAHLPDKANNYLSPALATLEKNT